MQRATMILLAGSALSAVAGGPARAQVESREGIALQNQIAELRQELQQTQQQVHQQGGGQAAPSYAPPQPAQAGGGDTAAELVVRVGTLEEQNRTLQGRVDDLANQLQHQHDELSKQIGDLAFKLGQGGTGTPAESPASPPPLDVAQPASPPPVAAPARRTPELALREGNAALARRNYPAAAAAAREVLANGHGASTTSAQFLLARAEGAQGQYKEAAADFYQAYNHAPRSPAAPVALLGVANSLIAMGDPRDACQALAKLSAEFPGAAGVKAGAASARKRAACGR